MQQCEQSVPSKLSVIIRSLIHTLGESFDGCGVISSIVNVARGNRQPLDLYLAETKAEDGIVQQNVGSLQICKRFMICNNFTTVHVLMTHHNFEFSFRKNCTAIQKMQFLSLYCLIFLYDFKKIAFIQKNSYF